MNRPNYFVLSLLLVVFIAPSLLAYVIYTHRDWLSNSTTNKGKLLTPPVLLESFPEHHKWGIALWHPTRCAKKCFNQLDKIARVRLALGRRLYEVETWLLTAYDTAPLSADVSKSLRDQDIQVFKFPTPSLRPVPDLSQSPALYIINPDHFLVLAYPLNTPPEAIYHDIKHLLQGS